MFDKMIFNVIVDMDTEAMTIADRNKLETWTNGGKTEYKSPMIANVDGINITIKEKKLQIKCSLHKLYFKLMYGILDNSQLFTLSQADKALNMLFDSIGIDKARAKITYFEIGLNIPTEHEPLEYIELVKSITTGKMQTEKEMFQDANYRKFRQKTTEKHKTIKKVFKIYDKEFEAAEKKRTQPTGNHILRIETMYRRQNIALPDFFSKANIQRLTSAFYKDWISIEFERYIEADNGVRKSEKENAKNILTLGREAYLSKVKAEFDSGLLTERQYRTVREFIRDWDSNKHKYRMLPTKQETEYRHKLKHWFSLSQV
ncbi:hypothetical protein PJIAN_4910 [Paludibacter jiangxiensis]|uniref:Replication initiation protein n=2 Tax=Paludibacter jiangxiensis TaxID=681398 RepID=A0A171AW57_9BACT|nr:hypothetical protein PJIAN_4910 [Paludibacter jiangxiensis]